MMQNEHYSHLIINHRLIYSQPDLKSTTANYIYTNIIHYYRVLYRKKKEIVNIDSLKLVSNNNCLTIIIRALFNECHIFFKSTESKRIITIIII